MQIDISDNVLMAIIVVGLFVAVTLSRIFG